MSPVSARSARSSAPPKSSSTARAATRAPAANRRAAPSTSRSRSSAASRTTRSSRSGPTRSGTSAPGWARKSRSRTSARTSSSRCTTRPASWRIAYKVYRCWVSEFQALPDLDANANAVAIQHIKLENEGWERDYDVTEPAEPSFTSRDHGRRTPLHVVGATPARDLGTGRGLASARPGPPGLYRSPMKTAQARTRASGRSAGVIVGCWKSAGTPSVIASTAAQNVRLPIGSGVRALERPIMECKRPQHRRRRPSSVRACPG